MNTDTNNGTYSDYQHTLLGNIEMSNLEGIYKKCESQFN